MDEITPAECNVRIKIEEGARWGRLRRHVPEDSLEDITMYLELNSQPQHPVVIDLVSQRIRLLVFPGRFTVERLSDDEAAIPRDDI